MALSPAVSEGTINKVNKFHYRWPILVYINMKQDTGKKIIYSAYCYTVDNTKVHTA